MSKPYALGRPASTMGEGRTNASKAREPLFKEALKGNENAIVGCSTLVSM